MASWVLITTAFVAALAIAAILFYYLWFLRNPAIKVPEGNNIVSPASGTISRIIRIEEGTVPETLPVEKGLIGKINARAQTVLGNSSGYLISIVMTPLDVHYQYAPCDGTIRSVARVPGKFLNAVRGAKGMRATAENEHAEILIDSAFGKIAVYPIAGFVARRIHTFVELGQKVKKGDKLGIIRLGSQVSMIIPDLKILVVERQKVTGGETILAQ